ncbi:hypothetical protein RVF83_11075 [Gordonia rubripertincta]|uniref:Uncharacterized protein n=1 Tax=Gordonia rubripertincta TaxID=36822 RepID=A0AAW6RHA8_GORRU|nr:hypothetical protein [Gordonia rubripertincta]MDG6783820.1 hypothetical protein [Gordonia rubripertincta]NKY64415.1 hypothetical protein [Gordonia rubripertincta]
MQAWVLVSGQIILQGVAFPIWLRARGSGAGGRQFTWLAASASVLLVGGIGWWRLAYVPSEYDFGAVVWIIFFSLLTAPLATVGFAMALRAASAGRPMLLASLTLPTSVLACALMPWFLSSESAKSIILSLCMFLGNVCFVAIAVLTERVSLFGGRNTVSLRQHLTSESAWFAARSGAGYSTGVILQTVASALPASALSMLSFSAKFVAGVVAVGVNAVLPRLVHRDRADTSGAFIIIRYVVGLCLLAEAVTAAVSLAWRPDGGAYLPLMPLVIAWAAAASINACVQRVALKSLAASSSKLTIMACACVSGLAFILSASGELNVFLLALLFIVLEISSALLLLLSMRQWKDVWVVGIGALICGFLVGFVTVMWH